MPLGNSSCCVARHRQPDPHRGALSLVCLQLKLPPVGMDDSPRHRQPQPSPPAGRLGPMSPWVNGCKRLSTRPSGIVPWLLTTRTSTPASSSRAVTTTVPPGSLNFTAFSNRFKNTSRKRSASPRNIGRWSPRPHRAHLPLAAVRANSAAASCSRLSRSPRPRPGPLAPLVFDEREEIVDQPPEAHGALVHRGEALPLLGGDRPELALIKRSSQPCMMVSGVRNSWLTADRRLDLS